MFGRSVMKFSTLGIGAVAVTAMALSACSGTNTRSGFDKNAPDEFRVLRKAPLTIPPDYNLRPPAPGEARPQELRPSDQARAALFGQDYGKDASQGEQLLVARAGGDAVDPSIRAKVDYDDANTVRKSTSFGDEVIAGELPDDPEAAEKAASAIEKATGGEDVIIQRKTVSSKLPGL